MEGGLRKVMLHPRLNLGQTPLQKLFSMTKCEILWGF